MNINETLIKINTEKITEAVAALCKQANLHVSNDIYEAIKSAYVREKNNAAKEILGQILENIRLANEKQRPLCQDTGSVVVFAEIGQNVVLQGNLLEDAINLGVEKAYTENKFRASIVEDPIFTRKNTNKNTPAVVYPRIVEGNTVKLSLLVKGCGSENVSTINMMKPFAGSEEIIDFVVNTVKDSVRNSCPPVRLGIGVGGTMEYAGVLSKKALLQPIKTEEKLSSLDDELSKMELAILRKSNELNIGASGFGGDTTVFGVNILSCATHIAALPVAISFGCHASRHAGAEIFEENIKYDFELNQEFEKYENSYKNYTKINIEDIEQIRNLKVGEGALISGYLYTARDAAHKKMIEAIAAGEDLPFDIKNKIIYYVGPCPATESEIIGPAGPTTATRMDKYVSVLMEKGLVGTIGKGKREACISDSIKQYKGVYFIATGGVACLLADKIKEAEIIAYPELESEAIYRLKVEDFPVIVGIDSQGDSIFES